MGSVALRACLVVFENVRRGYDGVWRGWVDWEMVEVLVMVVVEESGLRAFEVDWNRGE